MTESMDGLIGVGSVITSAEIVELPGDAPRLVLSSSNPDGTTGYASFYFRSNPQSIKQLRLDVIRGGTVRRSVKNHKDLFIEFVKDNGWTSITFNDVTPLS